MTLENTISLNEKFLFTIVSYILVLAIFMNQSFLQSPLLGIAFSFVYIFINGIFLGHVFFERQELFVRLMLGGLLFVILLGFVGWLFLIVYSLSVLEVTLVLLVCTTVASLLNKVMKHTNE